jgi:hypothetical protein
MGAPGPIVGANSDVQFCLAWKEAGANQKYIDDLYDNSNIVVVFVDDPLRKVGERKIDLMRQAFEAGLRQGQRKNSSRDGR